MTKKEKILSVLPGVTLLHVAVAHSQPAGPGHPLLFPCGSLLLPPSCLLSLLSSLITSATIYHTCAQYLHTPQSPTYAPHTYSPQIDTDMPHRSCIYITHTHTGTHYIRHMPDTHIHTSSTFQTKDARTNEWIKAELCKEENLRLARGPCFSPPKPHLDFLL